MIFMKPLTGPLGAVRDDAVDRTVPHDQVTCPEGYRVFDFYQRLKSEDPARAQGYAYEYVTQCMSTTGNPNVTPRCTSGVMQRVQHADGTVTVECRDRRPTPPPSPDKTNWVTVTELGLMFPPEGGTVSLNVNNPKYIDKNGNQTPLGKVLFGALSKSSPYNWELGPFLPNEAKSKNMYVLRNQIIKTKDGLPHLFDVRYGSSSVGLGPKRTTTILADLGVVAPWHADFVGFLGDQPDSRWERIPPRPDTESKKPWLPPDVYKDGYMGVPFMTFQHPDPELNASNTNPEVPDDTKWALWWKFAPPRSGDHRSILEITLAKTPAPYTPDNKLLYLLFPPALLWKLTNEVTKLAGIDLVEIAKDIGEGILDLLGELRKALCNAAQTKFDNMVNNRETWADEAVFTKLVKDNVSADVGAQIASFMVGGPLTSVAANGLKTILSNTVCSNTEAAKYPIGTMAILDPELAKYRILVKTA